LRDTLYIVIFGILIYLGIATIITEPSIIGAYGHAFAKYNHKYFGYLSYIYLFVLIYPLYKTRRSLALTQQNVETILGSILLFCALELIQGMLFPGVLQGKFSADFIHFSSPYIGVFGIWIFIFILLLVSLTIVFEEQIETLRYRFLQKLDASNGPTAKESDLHVETPKENIVELSEEESKEDTTLFEDQRTEFTRTASSDLDEPAYLRKEQNIVAASHPEVEPEPADEQKIQNVIEEDDSSHDTIVTLANKLKEQKSTIIVNELEENKKLLEDIEKGKVKKPKNFKLPSADFLQKAPAKTNGVDETELDDKIKDLIEKLAHFNIEGDVIRTYAGPVVSTFEFKPAANVKVSKILNLQDDLAMALRAQTIRIQAPIPGKDVVGIEIPNQTVETIYLRDLIESELFQQAKSPLSIVLGKDIVGKPFITDLKKLPHLLIAGTTGSGKSVGINGMILSLLYKNSPDQLRLLMIDPKMLEFSIYNDIPHLLTPVITKAKQAVSALNNMVVEMERRYAMMRDTRTKNIENYNEKMQKEGGRELSYIVVIIDELADLMMTSGKEVEHSIARLAQMARAAGIHLVVATQRPSVDVVTGLIKANLPSRISYRVGQKVDSKIILDQQGAESLLGRGDMLFTPPGSVGLVRLHAPWSTEEEIETIVDFLKSQREPDYDKSFLIDEGESGKSGSDDISEELDPLYEDAKEVVLTDKKTSISYLQRRLQIGYNRAARIIEQLEHKGVLSEQNAKGVREIL
jgi:DNA segregation ATPase FtsK/SpoIIIE, S-DNA-T family